MESSTIRTVPLKFSEIRSGLLESLPNVSLLLLFPSHPVSLSLGEYQELPIGPLAVELRVLDEPISQVELVLSEDFDKWISFNSDYEVRLSCPSKLVSPHKLKLDCVVRKNLSKCEYLKRIQLIENSEKDIKSRLHQLKQEIPTEYQEILGGNTVNSPAKAFFRKKTLENDAPKAKEADFTFSSYYDVELQHITDREEDLLQNAALGLLTRLSELKIQFNEIELHQEAMLDFDYYLISVKESLTETKDQCQTEEAKVNALVTGIKEEIKGIEKEELELDETINELLAGIEGKREEYDHGKNENAKNKRREGGNDDTVRMREELNECQDEILRLEQDYMRIIEKFNQEYKEKELSVAVNEKILGMAELQRLVNLRDLEMQENLKLKAELVQLEGMLSINDDLDDQIRVNFQEVGWNENSVQEYQVELGIMYKDLERSRLSDKSYSEGIEEELRLLQGFINKNADQVAGCNKEIERLKGVEGNIEKSRQDIVKLTLSPPKLPEIMNEFDRTYENSHKIQRNLYLELEAMSNLLAKHSSSSFKSSRIYNYMTNHIETQDLQHKSMKTLIASIKQEKPSYIAVKTDPTDVALGDYLNSSHNNLEIKPKRIDKQIYGFGTQKVEMKLENNILIVAVNGNRMTIEEFIQVYTPVERAKVFRRSSSKIGEAEVKKYAKLGMSPLMSIS